jgi:hypothetical protein
MSLVESAEVRLRAMASPEQADLIAKRVPREQVIGVRMRDTFALAHEHRRADLDDVRLVLRSPWYEMRMVAMSILDARARLFPPSAAERTALFELYLGEHAHIDTWDLVDRAAPRVVGEYLLDRDRAPLYDLVRSPNHWERRTAVVAGYWIIRNGEPDDPVAIMSVVADDPERFVQTALGTALRELRRAHPAAAARFEQGRTLHPAARRAAAVGRRAPAASST